MAENHPLPDRPVRPHPEVGTHLTVSSRVPAWVRDTPMVTSQPDFSALGRAQHSMPLRNNFAPIQGAGTASAFSCGATSAPTPSAFAAYQPFNASAHMRPRMMAFGRGAPFNRVLAGAPAHTMAGVAAPISSVGADISDGGVQRRLSFASRDRDAASLMMQSSPYAQQHY